MRLSSGARKEALSNAWRPLYGTADRSGAGPLQAGALEAWPIFRRSSAGIGALPRVAKGVQTTGRSVESLSGALWSDATVALPGVLLSKFGRPNYIFAPNPSVQLRDNNSPLYSYVRPLTTIEPTAIALGMPVNTQIGFDQIDQLQAELTKPIYANALIFVAWEHGYQDAFAKNLLKAYGGDPSVVPSWPGNDYDTIFIIRLKRVQGRTSATFTIDHEGLNDKLSNKCP